MKNKKIIAIVSVVVLAFGIIGGTLAWLTAQTDTLVNVFTSSNLKIDLEETEEVYQMVPGYTIHKDPVASVKAGSEECWLFVKLEKSDNFDTYMTYDIADGWTQLTEDKNGDPITDLIYYRKVLTAEIESETGANFHVLKDDQVYVLDTVTDEMMAAANDNQPTLSITAYASQLYTDNGTEFTAAQAWSNI